MAEKYGFRPKAPKKKVVVKQHTRAAPVHGGGPTGTGVTQPTPQRRQAARKPVYTPKRTPTQKQAGKKVVKRTVQRQQRPKHVKSAPYSLLDGPGVPKLSRPLLAAANKQTSAFRKDMK